MRLFSALYEKVRVLSEPLLSNERPAKAGAKASKRGEGPSQFCSEVLLYRFVRDYMAQTTLVKVGPPLLFLSSASSFPPLSSLLSQLFRWRSLLRFHPVSTHFGKSKVSLSKPK